MKDRPIMTVDEVIAEAERYQEKAEQPGATSGDQFRAEIVSGGSWRVWQFEDCRAPLPDLGTVPQSISISEFEFPFQQACYSVGDDTESRIAAAACIAELMNRVEPNTLPGFIEFLGDTVCGFGNWFRKYPAFESEEWVDLAIGIFTRIELEYSARTLRRLADAAEDPAVQKRFRAAAESVTFFE